VIASKPGNILAFRSQLISKPTNTIP